MNVQPPRRKRSFKVTITPIMEDGRPDTPYEQKVIEDMGPTGAAHTGFRRFLKQNPRILDVGHSGQDRFAFIVVRDLQTRRERSYAVRCGNFEPIINSVNLTFDAFARMVVKYPDARRASEEGLRRGLQKLAQEKPHIRKMILSLLRKE